jgi:hypothetical protein
MTKKLMLLLTLALLFMAACTAAGSNPTDSEIEPVFDQNPSVTEEEMPEQDMPEETAVPEEDAAGETQSSSPTTVDLSAVTPEAGSGDLVVQPAPGVPDANAKLLREITVDLSEKINVDVSDIEVAKIEEVVWNDSGLGCPQPDMVYMQVLTNGFRVTLNVNGVDYFYHTRGTDNFVLCQQTMNQPITLPPAPNK